MSEAPPYRIKPRNTIAAFYTVPYRLLGERVLVLGSSQVVRIFLDFQEVTSHPRAKQLWQVRRRPEHAPPELEEYLNLTQDGLVQWAVAWGRRSRWWHRRFSPTGLSTACARCAR